jgi:hypothetical protein
VGSLYKQSSTPIRTLDNVTSSSFEHLPPKVDVPSINEIERAELHFNFPTLTQPKPLYPHYPHDRGIMIKLLKWMASASPVGYETEKIDKPNLYPPALNIMLANGNELQFLPAYNITQEPHGVSANIAKGYVDLNTNHTIKTLRLYCPELENWLMNDWNKDIPWKRN